jgi:hypothetical protein
MSLELILIIILFVLLIVVYFLLNVRIDHFGGGGGGGGDGCARCNQRVDTLVRQLDAWSRSVTKYLEQLRQSIAAGGGDPGDPPPDPPVFG